MSAYANSIDTVFELIRKNGSEDYIGEAVTQEEHMVQSGMIAEQRGAIPQLIIACLFHDIGHLLHEDEMKMGKWGMQRHEHLGANYLQQLGFQDDVVDLVLNHVNAKRYLVGKDPVYMEKLSEASRATLEYQGGPMSADEIQQFEQRKNFKLYLELRKIEEEAKVQNMEHKPLEYFRKICFQCLKTA